MPKASDQKISTPPPTIDLIEQILKNCSRIAIKKLSRNDSAWADSKNVKQNGPYIPKEILAENFLPKQKLIKREKGARKIREVLIHTVWVRTRSENKESRFVYYESKNECRLTRVDHSEFMNLEPASYFIMGEQKENKDLRKENRVIIKKNKALLKEQDKQEPDLLKYDCLVINSSDEDALNFLETRLDLGSKFEFGIKPTQTTPATSYKEDFLEEMLEALKNGKIGNYFNECVFPKPSELAEQAQSEYLRTRNYESLNPFKLDSPGDVLKEISRDIEYELFRRESAKSYSALLLHMLDPKGHEDILRGMVTNLLVHYDAIYKEVMVSAGQRSKCRAGSSFEIHVQRMLDDGGIPYEAQKLVGGNRPDFIIPSVQELKKVNKGNNDVIILSLKTSLRERWKEVLSETHGCKLYLATVDDRISESSITQMDDSNVTLVVPESLKNAKFTCYESKKNVITFKTFFEMLEPENETVG